MCGWVRGKRDDLEKRKEKTRRKGKRESGRARKD
jgi:hypothetical protein